MDGGRQHENGRHKMDYYRGVQYPVIRKHFYPDFLKSSLFKYAIHGPFEWNRNEMCSGI